MARDTTHTLHRSSGNAQREKLLMVGLELFSSRDFASVTIKEIAKAAKVNSALIYYYFRNKEDLFRASIEYAILQALENYSRLKDRHSNPVDLIDDWFENNIEMAPAFQKLVKVLLDYSNSRIRLASVDALAKLFYREEISILSNSIRHAVGLGAFDPVDADRAATFASVHLDGIMAASMIRRDFDLGAEIANLREQFWLYVGYRKARRTIKKSA
ncbi:MAG TPA: helix-turn-helix domain-containing protein [Alphaproteobacteria bacterium]|nr:helix-turn-helix domain-containing protein [Alphaproteobacteria bacterium]